MEPESASLAYGYGWRNAGDFAINKGSLQYISSILPSVTPKFVSIFPEETEKFHETEKMLTESEMRYQLQGGPITYDPNTGSAFDRTVHLIGDGLQYAMDQARLGSVHERLGSQMAETIHDSDLFFYNGGNLIHHNRSLPYLLGILYPLHLAQRHDVPYILLPHTIFDIEGRYHRVIRSVLEGSELVWTRDNRSYNYLNSEFSLSVPIRNGIDTAFFLNDIETGSADSRKKTNEETEIAVVPRFSTLGDTGNLEDDRMEQTFKTFIMELSENGYRVTVTVQTKVEERWVKNNAELLENEGVGMFKSYNPSELREHYEGVDLLLTMRLHAGIFALSSGTPTIGLYRKEWGPKTPGTWENLGIEEYAVPWEEITVDGLYDLTREVLDNRSDVSNRIVQNINERKSYMIEETQSVVGI